MYFFLQIFNGPSTASEVTIALFPNPTAYFFRVVVDTWFNDIQLQMDIIGCEGIGEILITLVTCSFT